MHFTSILIFCVAGKPSNLNLRFEQNAFTLRGRACKGQAMNSETKRFLSIQLIWIGVSLALSIALAFLLPFPASLIAMVAVFMMISYLIRRRASRRTEMQGSEDSSLVESSGTSSKLVVYYCLGCGLEHEQSSCPRCGSKMRRVGF